MIYHALEARLVPLILLLMLLEETLKGLFILCSFIPNGTVTDFIEQQSIVIFLDQIAHLGIDSRQGVCTLVEQTLLSNRFVRGLYDCIQLLFCDCFAGITLLQITQDILLVKLERLKLLALFHQNDMPAIRR